ncbi:MAG: sigma-70 family RNA polymerase sigma factor [Saprospiraceae bacterium]|nr:sigma-70 family RNA polymerase sigma factor [Saprospiraceae bacterium]
MPTLKNECLKPAHDALSESSIVQLIKLKDPSGMDYLHTHYRAALYRLIVRIVKVDVMAEEVLQDVFVTIWQQIDRYDTYKGRLFTWMSKIAKNMAIDRLRSKDMRVWKHNSAEQADWQELAQLHSSSLRIDTLGIESLFTYLSDRQQKVMRFIYIKGYTQSETAESCHLPLGTVKTLVRSSLKTLRKILRTTEKEEIPS